MNRVFEIADGKSVCSFGINGDYRVLWDGWAPVVAPLRENELGGASELTPVEEVVQIGVRGETRAAIRANAQKLADVLSNGRQWQRGRWPYPAVWRYRPEGSDLMKAGMAVVMGGSVQLPRDFETAKTQLGTLEAQASMRVWRGGEWLLPGNVALWNSRFDDWDGVDFAEWTQMNDPDLERVTAANTFLFGTGAARILNSSTAEDRGIWQDVALAPGEYTISAWARPVNGSIRLAVYFHGGFSGAEVADSAAGGNQWERLSITWTVGEMEDGLRVALLAPGAGHYGVFDGVKVERGAAATDYDNLLDVRENFDARAEGENGGRVTAEFNEDMTAAGHGAPVVVLCEGYGISPQGVGYNPNFIVLTDNEKDVGIFSAHGMAGGQFASESDTGNFALGDHYLRYTPGTSLADDLSASFQIPADVFNLEAERIGILCNVRTFSATNEFSIWPRLSVSGVTVEGPRLAISGDPDDGPAWVYWGTISRVGLPVENYFFRIRGRSLITDGALGIDAICLVNLDNPSSRILAILPGQDVTQLGVLGVDHRLLSAINPIAGFYGMIESEESRRLLNPVVAQGRRSLRSRSHKMVAAWLGTGGSGGGGSAVTNWRATAAGSLLENVWHFRRMFSFSMPR